MRQIWCERRAGHPNVRKRNAEERVRGATQDCSKGIEAGEEEAGTKTKRGRGVPKEDQRAWLGILNIWT